MIARWTARLRSRLATRMVAWAVTGFLAVQAVVLLAVSQATAHNAVRLLDAELRVGERVWQRLLAQRADTLGRGAALLAADFGFRDAVTSGDAETVRSALANHGARIGADWVALTDPAMRPQQVVSTTDDGGAAARRWPDGTPLPRSTAPALAVVAGRVYQFVVAPVQAPVVVGHVVMGFRLDDRLLHELRGITGLQAALVLHAPGADGVVQVLEATPEAPALLAGPAGDAAAGHRLHRVPLALPPGDAQAAAVVLASPLDKALAPFHGLLLALAAVTALGAVGFVAMSRWGARRITGPLRQLVRASDRLASGDYDTPIPAAPQRDEVGELGRAFEHMRSRVASQAQEVQRLAWWDRLTGLPNRTRFRETLDAALREGRPAAVLMLDVDRFKHVNDVLGYASGDRLLCSLAERLQALARPGDLVARLGGDEFALLLRDVDAGLARARADALQAALAEPLSLDDQRVDVAAAIGLAASPEHGCDADLLLSRAEIAMYAAKRGRDGIRGWDRSLDPGSARTLSLLSELRDAVAQGHLRLYVQPKARVHDRSLGGAEALVRWQHPTRGLVPPVQFIPFAEQTGFIRHITLWMFEEAARCQAALAAAGVQRLSLNLSTRDLLDAELPARLDALLVRHGARADGLCLEITESATMDDPALAEATLHALAARGYKLSIDDFGTGYSSLAYLRRLPVHELKIDRSFVVAMTASEGDANIVRSTIALAHTLGLSVVAEGVETEAQFALLQAHGCDEVQGWLIDRPMPWRDFVERQAARATAAPSLDAAARPDLLVEAAGG